MKLLRTNRTRAAALGAVALSGALVLSACGSDDNTGNGGGAAPTSGASDIECGNAKGQLLASGSSAQKNAVDQWVKDYTAACSGVTVNYKATGSGAGIQEFLQGKTGFAGSDSALKPDEVTQSKKVCKSGQGINLPMVGGPIAVGFNVDGVDKLTLDAQTLAQIFNGKIKTWDDAAIKKLNPDADLPDTKIQPVSRSDESGTTDNFTSYLAEAAPKAWPHEPGKKWPVKGGQSADGSAGVSSQVKQTSGAISYFELSYAHANSIKTVDIDTGSGDPVEATTANASKAIAAAKVTGKGKDLAMELDYTTKEPGAYPITLLTYEIACDTGNKKDTLDAVKSFLTYTASDKGQDVLDDLGYAPLPAEVQKKVQDVVSTLS
ncbi:phosphate ABC transporter substrate-binding protein PstS [Streptomyces boninensis]|uniref:phosphate ABC transporter substrate-binding protein PstS n=1 Tax=Streptomyces boninensis TaxID=2039455 RepID=UPI003B2181DC